MIVIQSMCCTLILNKPNLYTRTTSFAEYYPCENQVYTTGINVLFLCCILFDTTSMPRLNTEQRERVIGCCRCTQHMTSSTMGFAKCTIARLVQATNKLCWKADKTYERKTNEHKPAGASAEEQVSHSQGLSHPIIRALSRRFHQYGLQASRLDSNLVSHKKCYNLLNL